VFLKDLPPANMAKIPGITCPGEVDIPKENGTDNIPAQKTGGKFKYRLYSCEHVSTIIMIIIE
jgi:hypothetical protein